MIDDILNRIDLATGELASYTDKIERYARDMAGFFLDAVAQEEMENTLIYDVFAVEHDAKNGELSYAVTKIYPGRIGDEFFMTKGHFHTKTDTAEIYIVISGKGVLLLQKDDVCNAIPVERGSILYVPPDWAHRSVNVGEEPFIFLAVYPSDAGHNYGPIAEYGFKKLVLKERTSYAVVDNPRYSSA